MKNRLIKLADYFDSIGKDGFSNYIDGILKSSQMFSNNPRAGRTDELPKEPNKINFVSFKKDNGEAVKIFIKDNLLLKAIKEITYKLFMLEDSDLTVNKPNVTKNELEYIYSESIKYDQDFNYYNDNKDNLSALTPSQFSEIVTDIFKIVSYEYPGNVRRSEVELDVREFLINQYSQVYLEDYLGRKSEIEDYPISKGQERLYQPKTINQEEMDKLKEENRKHIYKMREIETAKRMYPEWAEKERLDAIEKIKNEKLKDHPEWASILLQSED